METVQIPLQRGVIGSSGVSMMVDIHHHVLKSTTSVRAERDVRDMRERRDSKFWPEIPKPRTSDL
jgi:hypothetical protein